MPKSGPLLTERVDDALAAIEAIKQDAGLRDKRAADAERRADEAEAQAAKDQKGQAGGRIEGRRLGTADRPSPCRRCRPGGEAQSRERTTRSARPRCPKRAGTPATYPRSRINHFRTNRAPRDPYSRSPAAQAPWLACSTSSTATS